MQPLFSGDCASMIRAESVLGSLDKTDTTIFFHSLSDVCCFCSSASGCLNPYLKLEEVRDLHNACIMPDR